MVRENVATLDSETLVRVGMLQDRLDAGEEKLEFVKSKQEKALQHREIMKTFIAQLDTWMTDAADSDNLFEYLGTQKVQPEAELKKTIRRRKMMPGEVLFSANGTIIEFDRELSETPRSPTNPDEDMC